ncbi:MAG TPA: contact-dependent growth inhibition system immunity protein [Dinghuibacter sp.]|jgi:hypothetical protein|uniref:contact-dependent growth inhibition system immunity protein n=1 Tax=Dinghuibacter sp. TaxID=2024697 RepID=UPI002B9155A3|nr:contact-dependent growth inhibition system immunity protein [Dinghuibacter sp.]HTJ11132.1 contact-dependent growth inhibition system immunity protein [Dinghuibacter sp.]
MKLQERLTALREVPTATLTPADIRLLVSQQTRLEELVPLALGLLAANPLLETEVYPGDLLGALANVDLDYWGAHPDQQQRLFALRTRAKAMK